MFSVFRKELDWGGRKLVIESGKVARQADGAAMVSYGDTTALCTAVGAQSPKPGQDFFPLTVNYQEKAFAAGKIPGGFFKREGRPSEKETLVSRLIDRPIRPLFVDGYKNETQVVAAVLAHDLENDPGEFDDLWDDTGSRYLKLQVMSLHVDAIMGAISSGPRRSTRY